MLTRRPLRRGARIAGIAALLSLSGCFVYEPVRLDAVPPGQSVRLRLVRAPAELAEAGAGAGRVLRGTLVRKASDQLYVRVPVAVRREGFESRAIEQEVAVAPDDVVEIELRRPSLTRTALLVAGTAGAAAVVISRIIDGRGARELDGVEPPAELRVPLGF